MQDFRKLEVWRRSHQLTLQVYRMTKIFPGEERFGLTAQVQRAVPSIELNLAEGSSRGTDADFRRFVRMASGPASEVECQFLIARDLGYLSAEKHGEMEAEVQGIKRMLIRLSQKLTANR